MDKAKIENVLLNSGFTYMQSEALSYLMAEMATKDTILAFQGRLFTHVLALIGALTAIMTLLLLLIR